jgi:UDP-N-acetylglucosamine 2-epimerase (non-hydrolysing)
MQLVSVVGARPQLVKLAPVSVAAKRLGVSHVIIHTGQHYDPDMSDVFFDELAIPAADVNLGVGSGPHGRQTAAMLAGLEDELIERSPDWVLAYGDTNSTVAAALAAVKLHLPVAHLEAGLRSFNRRMPEEHNRVLTDHAADLLLAPSDTAVANLEREGLADRTRKVGDVMVDVVMAVRRGLDDDPPRLPPPCTAGQFLLATIHRAENTDERDRLSAIIDALADAHLPVVLAAHPRLRARAAAFDIALQRGAITVVDPLPYRSTVAATVIAAGVVTDSGGLQKEAFVLGTPCTTVRPETEWTETLEGGWNVLAPEPAALREALRREPPTAGRGSPYGAGTAAEAVLRALLRG